MEISLRRYGIDALGAMAQGLFCSLLIGTILNTLGQQFHIGFLNAIIFTLGKGDAAVGYTIGGCASLMVGPAMAVAIGYALHAPAMVLFSLVPVGYATNAMGGAGGPLAVLVTAIVAAEFGKAVSKETKVDILVTPIVTILVGIGLAMLVAAPIGKAASWVGTLIMWATAQQPFVMGILVSVIVGIALTLPISSAPNCAAHTLTRHPRRAAQPGVPDGGAPQQVAHQPQGHVGPAVFHIDLAAVGSAAHGDGVGGLSGPLGVWPGWVAPSEAAIANGAVAIQPGAMDWIGLIMVCFVLPAVICWAIGLLCRRLGWIREGDLKLD